MIRSLRTYCFWATPSFLAVVVASGVLLAQKPVIEFDSPPYDHPISQSWINGIHQSRDGFIWMGTTSGLVRFDGYEYKTYLHNPRDSNSISDNWVTEILEDKNGHLWIATDGGGINEYLPERDIFRAYRHRPEDETSLSSDRVLAGAYGSDETLWFGTQMGGLNRLDLRTGTFIRHRRHSRSDESLSDDRVWSVWEDSLNAKVWIGTRGGLDRLDLNTGQYTHYRNDPSDPSSLSNNFVMSIRRDSRNRLWVGTRIGLNRLDPGETAFTRFVHEDGDSQSLLNDYVFDVFEDTQRRIWIAVDGGVSLWNEPGSNFFNYPAAPDQETSLNSGTVWQTYEDREGRLWISTYGGGYSVVHRFKRKMDHYNLPFNDPALEAKNAVIGFVEEPAGAIWVVSWSGLHLFDLKGKTFRRFSPPGAPASEWRVWGVTKTADRQFVFINPTGYLGFDPGSGTFLPDCFGENTPSVIPTGIAADRDGNCWMFSNQTSELFRRDARSGEWGRIPPEGGFPQAPVNRLFVDSRDRLWVGTDGEGLFKWSPGDKLLVHYAHDPNDPASISSNFIHAIYEDSRGNLWIGARNGGLNLLLAEEGAGKFRHWTRYNSDLESDLIQSILEDQYGRLWLGADNGLYCFNPREKRFQHFGVHDGLYSYGSWSGAALRTQDSTLIFGARNGFNLLRPGRIRENPFKPKVVITDFLLFNQPVATQGTFADTLDFSSPLQKNIAFTGEIELKWWQNDVAFEFAALNYTLPQKNQYLYRLEGLQEEWVETNGLHRRATYTNVAPGEYTFHVLASNNDGLWNEEGVRLRISILPPWWTAWWAYVLYAVAIIALIYLYLYLQFKQRLAQAKASHLEEIDLAKTRLYTNISHEFRNPITIISGMAQQIGEAPERWFREGLDMIRQNAQQLLNLVNQMLELRKLEAGALPVYYRQGEVISFLRQLVEPFTWQAQVKEVQLHFLPGQKEIWMDFDLEKLIRIVSNLLSNAIKFTPANGNIYVQADRTDRHGAPTLTIKVRDTGIGIAVDQLPYIFERFYQADAPAAGKRPGSVSSGTGIGLALISELVKLLKGEVSVESEPGRGTEFTIFLPIHNSAPRLEPSEEKDLAKTVLEVAPAPIVHGESSDGEERPAQLPIALVVEDNPDVIAYMRACLQGQFWVETATDGATGRDRAVKLIPDIVVSDVMMPGMDGYELCQTLKRDERTNHIPVILLTAKADHFSRLTGLEVGADTYLTKPFDREELLASMKNLLTVREQVRRHYQEQAETPSTDAAGESATEKQPPEDPFVRKVRELVEANIDDFDLKVQILCDELHLSHSQLHRKLTAVCGLSPNRFIRLVRLQRARELLLDREGSITAVAFDTGFQDPDYFSRVFRETYDQTPSEFRRAHGMLG